MLLDGWAVGLLYAVKLWRIMALWVALYVMEKVFQDGYVQRVMADRKKPDQLALLVTYALCAELCATLLLLGVLALFMTRFKTARNTYVIDTPLFVLVAVDYVVTTGVLLALGVLVARAVQDPSLYRYRDDGLRGIRAYCTLMLNASVVVLAAPMFAVAT